MKNNFYILLILILITGCSKSPISITLLKYDKSENTYYLNEKEFTGKTFANGNTCRSNFKKGKIHGKEMVFSSDGNLIQQSIYKNGIIQSYTTYYHQTGNKKYFKTYKNNKPHGPEVKWDINGKKSVDKIFNEGKIEVSFSKYNNGNIKFEQHQKGDHLKLIKYREDGTKLYEKNYLTNNGRKKHGEHKFYNADGKLMRTEIYKDDILVN